MSYLWRANENYSMCLPASTRSGTAEWIIMNSDVEEICELFSSILNFYPNQIPGRYISHTPIG
jgi:hypothetical protein